MKLHLPKNILVTVLVAMATTSAYAADYEVGTHTGGNNLPSASKNYTVYQGDVTLGTGDRMGTFKNGELLTDKDFGKDEWKQESSV